MGEQRPANKDELRKKILPLVVKELQKGASRESVFDKIQRVGFNQQESEEILSLAVSQAGITAHAKAPAAPQQTAAAMPPGQAAENPKAAAMPAQIVVRPAQKSYLITLGAGLAAAVVGGALWGLIGILFKRELGIIAILMGVGPGLAMVWYSYGRKGLALEVPAVLFSLLGILIGKYITFVFLAHLYIGDDPVKEQMYNSLSYYSLESVFVFFTTLPKRLHIADAVWVLLAVINAFMLAEQPREWANKIPAKN